MGVNAVASKNRRGDFEVYLACTFTKDIKITCIKKMPILELRHQIAETIHKPKVNVLGISLKGS